MELLKLILLALMEKQSHPLYKTLRLLSILLFLAALVSIPVMLLSDAIRHYKFTSTHQHVAAIPLVLIGLSYISLQLSARRTRAEMAKGLLLGIAFVLWGIEQLLPQTPLVTVIDSVVVTIFVIDLSLIIAEHLLRRDKDQILP